MIAFLFFFKTFAFGNSSFVLRLLALFGTVQKNTCKTQSLITLLVQRTSGEENYSFSEFFTCLDEWMGVKFEH